MWLQPKGWQSFKSILLCVILCTCWHIMNVRLRRFWFFVHTPEFSHSTNTIKDSLSHINGNHAAWWKMIFCLVFQNDTTHCHMEIRQKSFELIKLSCVHKISKSCYSNIHSIQTSANYTLNTFKRLLKRGFPSDK